MKILAVIGMPGTGKTTLLRNIIKSLRMTAIASTKSEKHPLVVYHQAGNLYILGKYDNDSTFGGTDLLSMAAQPQAIDFVDELANDNPDAVVIFEGDRLSTPSFLNHCVENPQIRASIFYLTTSQDKLNERYAERGSNQDARWLEGRQSKYNRILSDFSLMEYIQTLRNDDEHDADQIKNHIIAAARAPN